MAKTMGLSAIFFNILAVKIPDVDKPIKTSESTIASSKVDIFLDVANSALLIFKFFLFLLITPLLSSITILSLLRPNDL
ncbi:MAG: Uncharacterised protein [Flavobacteriaceae bacterium]|nr:MAG: Uncharacterised protein [Flavobacteriaceae bacterium]